MIITGILNLSGQVTDIPINNEVGIIVILKPEITLQAIIIEIQSNSLFSAIFIYNKLILSTLTIELMIFQFQLFINLNLLM